MLNPEKTYRIGEPENYTSMYGYPKRRFTIYEVIDGHVALGATCIGFVKEEKVIDEAGGVDHFMFYERNGWKTSGQQRFYTTVEALLRACGAEHIERSYPKLDDWNAVATYPDYDESLAPPAPPAAKAKKTARKAALTSREEAAAKAKRMKKATRRAKKAA